MRLELWKQYLRRVKMILYYIARDLNISWNLKGKFHLWSLFPKNCHKTLEHPIQFTPMHCWIERFCHFYFTALFAITAQLQCLTACLPGPYLSFVFKREAYTHIFSCVCFFFNSFQSNNCLTNRCWSFVGRTGYKQDLSLAAGCWHEGTIVHEIGELRIAVSTRR